VSINGKHIHSYGEAGDALLALRDSERIDVELLREQTPLHLVYYLK
jgi:hypothetical protein